MRILRPWQQTCLEKAINWFKEQNRLFMVGAAPGSGKTTCAVVIANELIKNNEIDCVIAVAPRRTVVSQWAADFQLICGRPMLKITGHDEDLSTMGGMDFAVTWSAIHDASPAFYKICQENNVLLICDEHHHAGKEAAWGLNADSAFAAAKHVLVLSGTPIRTDGSESVWLNYDPRGGIDHPRDGTFTLTYGEAVDLGYCRPITFHRHDGNFSVQFQDGDTASVNGQGVTMEGDQLERLPSLKRAIDFIKLASTPIYEKDGSPSLSSYPASMLECGIQKLDDMKLQMPKAGGLVIAPTIEMANYMADLLEMLEGVRPFVVHNQVNNSDAKIEAFRSNNHRWLVSVGMVSEGVDIPRLRILVYLPHAKTELAFRQAMGRVVRNFGPNDITRAYVIMPAFQIFDEFARRVEREMSPKFRSEPKGPSTKLCPICSSENELSATHCSVCDEEFPVGHTRFKSCGECETPNPVHAKNCIACGESFEHEFNINLDEALRHGAIARGMDLDESEVVLSENISQDFRKKVLNSGDEVLINIIKTIPEETYGRLLNMVDGIKR